MSTIVWTHRCRIYRAYFDLTHDLNPVSTAEDIYEEDKSCRLLSGTTEILAAPGGGELGFIQHPVDLWFPRGLDVREGTFVQVRKPRVIDGDREQVLGTLTANAVTGATSLTLDTTTGFEPGDEAEITDGVNRQVVRVKTVSSTGLVLYAQSALLYDFDAESTAAVDYWYTIHSVPSPHGLGPVTKALGTRKYWTNID